MEVREREVVLKVARYLKTEVNMSVSEHYAYEIATAIFELCTQLMPARFVQDEPREALAILGKIFVDGNAKHGNLDWKLHHSAEFIEKAERHRLKRIMGAPIDGESGCPHLIHSAADLLLAAELEIPGYRKRGLIR